MKIAITLLWLAGGWLSVASAADAPPAPVPPTLPVPGIVPAANAATNKPANPATGAATNNSAAATLPAIPVTDYSYIAKLKGTNLANELNKLRANGQTNLAAIFAKQYATNLVDTGGAGGPGGIGAVGAIGALTNLLAGRGLGGGTNAAAGGTNLAEEIIAPGVIRFQAADLNAVLEVYAELVNRTILRPSSLPDTKITLKSQTPLTRSEAIRALEAVLNMNQITIINVADKFVKIVPQPQAFPEIQKLTDPGDVSKLEELAGYVTVIRQLTNAKPSEVINALTPFAKMQGGVVPIDSSGIIVMRDYGDNIKRMMEMLDKIDVSMPLEVEPVVIPIKYALAGDIAQVLGQLTSGGSVSTTGSSGASRGLSKSTSNYRGAGGMGGMPGQQGYNPSYPGGMNQGITPQANPASTQTDFQKRLSSIVSKAAGGSGDIQVLGQAKIIADERINALLVFADKRDRDMITNIISKLDVVSAQVLIEALVIEVSLNDSSEYGLSYLQRAVSRGKYSSAGAINNGSGNPFQDPAGIGGIGTNLASGFSYFMKWGSFDVAAKAAASDGRISVLSRPRVQTSHAMQANLFVGETRPYPTGSSYGGLYGGSYNQIQQLQIGITLEVLPLINPDGLVVMEINQIIENVGDPVKIENVGEVPSTVSRRANAKVAVMNGETIILGGFISADRSKSKSGVPILKDIPGLGALFRSTSEKRNRKELIVFIRPTVLDTPKDAAALAAAERARISPINQVEQQFKLDEIQRTEDLKREMDGKRNKNNNKSASPKAPDAGLQSFPVN